MASESSPNEELRRLLDTAAIRDLVERYFHALDSSDAAAMRSCFAPGSEVVFHAGTEGEFQREGQPFAEYLIEGFSRHKARTHIVGTIQVAFAGDRATARTQAVAFLVDHDDKGHVRGLLYEDELARHGGVWKIVFRRHTPRWQYDVAVSSPHVFQWARELAASRS